MLHEDAVGTLTEVTIRTKPIFSKLHLFLMKNSRVFLIWGTILLEENYLIYVQTCCGKWVQSGLDWLDKSAREIWS